MQILIAEDNPTSALFLHRTLERLGHDVDVVVDGVKAWEAVRTSPVPLLISDWMMPWMDGLEPCRRIRVQDNLYYVYIIILASKDRRGDRLDGLRAGADDFLTKPLDAEKLVVLLGIASRIVAVHQRLKRQNELLAELASVDELTATKNRRRFREDLELYFALWSRQAVPLSLVLLDVDHFKQYNDTFGHPAGDEVLRHVAGLLRGVSRNHNVVARYGGEEFAILLPSTPATEAMAVAERLRSQIEFHPWPLRPVTVSLGVATTRADTPSCGSLVEAADQALYQSKRLGRNRVTHHDLSSESACGAVIEASS